MAEYIQQYFAYSTGWFATAAAAGAAATATLQIQADADFQANYMTIAVRQANLIIANFAGDIIINDTAVGRTLFNVPSAIDAFIGNGQLPYPFNPPRLFKKNSTITITVNNPPVLAIATGVQVVFHGNKLWPTEQI